MRMALPSMRQRMNYRTVWQRLKQRRMAKFRLQQQLILSATRT
jgi:hypothetical protein